MANSVSALIPEVWAQESLMTLTENVVMPHLVHTDFKDEIAEFGDTVNADQPGSFVAQRKTDADDVVTQDASSTSVPVLLNQHQYISFVLKDGQVSKSFKDLFNYFLKPAVIGMAQMVDEVLIGCKYAFFDTVAGQVDAGATIASLTNTGSVMDRNNVPRGMGMRNMVVSPEAADSYQQLSTFHEADKMGDDGTALREGSLGRKFGFDLWNSQNQKLIVANATQAEAGLVTNTEAVGATTIEVTSITSVSTGAKNGMWCLLAGDMTPQLITASTDSTANAWILTIYPGLRYEVAAGNVITIYGEATINQSVATTGYASGYSKTMIVDTTTTAIQAGQMLSIGEVGASLAAYSSISTEDTSGNTVPNVTTFMLNRSLDADIADGAGVGLGPEGDYGFAFHRNAVALVSRPLATPPPDTGVRSFVATDPRTGLAMRVTMTYDGKAQGTRVTVDFLFGVKVLNKSLGALVCF